MPHFLVERYLSEVADESLDYLAVRLDRAAASLRAEGISVFYLSSTLLRGERCCFCLFEADSVEDVIRANQEAGSPFDRIGLAVHAGIDCIERAS